MTFCSRCIKLRRILSTTPSVGSSGKSQYRNRSTLTDAARSSFQTSDNESIWRQYRNKGYIKANLDPLGLSVHAGEDNLQDYLNDEVLIDPSNPLSRITDSEELRRVLEIVYTEGSSLEAGHIESNFERNWLFNEFEKLKSDLNDEVKLRIGEVLLNGEKFDKFTAAKFPTVKRYGGEGAESMLVFCDSLFSEVPSFDTKNVIIGIAHRGRSNLLTTLLNCPPELLFRKMKGLPGIPKEVQNVMDDDVLSHIRTSVDLENGLHVSLLPNPSHLEAVNPVCLGKTKSKQKKEFVEDNEARDSDSVCLLVHGDGAFAGQGIVAECFNMAYVPNYDVGGCIHLLTNNQLAFTMQSGFSSRHSSDVSKIIGCPVIHVNGDSPEDAYRAAVLCVKYRSYFRKDIVCNLVCYRRWGHNEMDDATLTQPLMYDVIESKPSPPALYLELLKAKLPPEKLSRMVNSCALFSEKLEESFKRTDTYEPVLQSFQTNWSSCNFPKASITNWDTGIEDSLLKYIGSASVTFPEDFNVQSKLFKTLSSRVEVMKSGAGIDWATAEALAFGSLMIQGHDIRLSGEDVGRGTFSHRHVQLIDQKTLSVHVPLNAMQNPSQLSRMGSLEVCNSILSEEAVLGFEYGYSIDCPNTLVIWESQFGDFFNGAQIIIDTFIASGESKWGLQSGIVLLLPHGLDGMGPEHSSCRIERFLQLTDSSEDSIDSDRVNMCVVNPTTPAQYFHVLRRQQVRNFRKPLIIASPKKLLRLPEAKSKLVEFAPGSFFKPVLDDDCSNPHEVKRVVFVSGKLWYLLKEQRKSRGLENVAIVRLEQLCPLPCEELQDVVQKYMNCEDFVWCQEEHRNSGPWSFVGPRFSNLVGVKLRYVGRSVRAVPATAIGTRHKIEEADILTEVFK